MANARCIEGHPGIGIDTEKFSKLAGGLSCPDAVGRPLEEVGSRSNYLGARGPGVIDVQTGHGGGIHNIIAFAIFKLASHD